MKPNWKSRSDQSLGGKKSRRRESHPLLKEPSIPFLSRYNNWKWPVMHIPCLSGENSDTHPIPCTVDLTSYLCITCHFNFLTRSSTPAFNHKINLQKLPKMNLMRWGRAAATLDFSNQWKLHWWRSLHRQQHSKAQKILENCIKVAFRTASEASYIKYIGI